MTVSHRSRGVSLCSSANLSNLLRKGATSDASPLNDFGALLVPSTGMSMTECVDDPMEKSLAVNGLWAPLVCASSNMLLCGNWNCGWLCKLVLLVGILIPRGGLQLIDVVLLGIWV